MTPARWGIVGTGGMAAKMATTMRAHPDVDVVAVGSRSIEAARFFAEAHEIPHADGSHDAVAGRDDVDVVYVASTNDLHRENVLSCLEAGKPVLCEKPLALNATQAAEMVDAAAGAGVFFMEAMWMRFQPFLDTVDELVASGAIGKIRLFQATFGFPANPDPARRWFNPAMGGGSLLDLGIYPVTLAYHLLGPPVSCSSEADLTPDSVDRQLSVSGLHESGAMSTLTSSLLGDAANEAIISGDKGRIRIHSPFHHSHRVTLEREGAAVAAYDTGHEGTGLEFEIDEVHRCLAEGLTESTRMPLGDSLAVMRWMDEIRQEAGIVYPGE